MDNFVDTIEFIKKRFYHLDGLIALETLLVTFYVLLSDIVGDRLFSVFQALPIESPKNIGNMVFLAGLATVIVTGILYWHAKRRAPTFKRDELGVIFAPIFPKDLHDDVEHLDHCFKQELKSHQLQNEFSVRRLPPNLTIHSEDDAKRILRKSGGILAIWGLMDTQVTESGRQTAFSRISFTFIHDPKRVPLVRYYSLARSIIGQHILVKEDTQVIDRAIMARDMSIIVRNTMGVVLIIEEKWDQAIKVFAPLHSQIEILRDSQNFRLLKEFRRQVGYDLAWSLTMNCTKQYERYLYNGRLFDIPNETLTAWIRNTEQAIELDPQNSSHYLFKALLAFLLEQQDVALNAAHRAKQLAPNASALPYFSLAFLYNFRGDIEKSRSNYRSALRKKTSADREMIDRIMLFIRQCVHEYPEKHQIKFALAFLEYHCGSIERSVSALDSFLSTPMSNKLRKLHQEANSLRESIRR